MARAESGMAERAAAGSMAAALPDIGAEALRRAVADLATAVSVVATDGPAGRAGLTCSAVSAVGAAPPTILACVHGRSAAHAIIRANGAFAVSILNAQQSALPKVFAGIGNVPMAECFADGAWRTLATGAPCHAGALCALDAVLIAAHEVKTHSILIGRLVGVTDGAAAQPLIYHRRAYATTRPL